MQREPFSIVRLSALVMALALLVVGAVSDGILRHVVQTLPLWLIVATGARPWIRWFAIPPFAIWLAMMIVIWLFLAGIAHVISGHFSPTEIAMTVVVAIGAVAGLVSALRWRTLLRPAAVVAVLVVSTALQIGLLTVSFRPVIAKDTAFAAWVHSGFAPRP